VTERCDILVIGAGIVGLAIARELRARRPDARILVLEKEAAPGRHASGRNSGVLHAGFYYAADSLKARFTREGNQRLRAYCDAYGLALLRCGKLVVARDEAEDRVLDTLLERAAANGVELHAVTREEAREIEPRARTWSRALFSPTTSSVDPGAVVAALAAEAEAHGVRFAFGTRYLGREGRGVRTSAGTVAAGYVVNAAGLYADRVAHDFGFGRDYTLVPFKGLYLKARPGSPPLRTHVYPVPDLRNPFLGVHLTVTVDGRAKIGPSATPALWPEQYAGLAGLHPGELARTLAGHLRVMARGDRALWSLALDELRLYRPAALVRRAAGLVTGLAREDFPDWAPAGIRAQLVDRRTGRLEMDFRVEGDDRSMHVLNAVSPAFTCALPFAGYVADRVDAAGG
jgi:L-2-hydroxyglutarate oxidase LhgO